MYKLLNQDNFIDAFLHAGKDKKFSFEGKVALYEWLEDNIENYKLDVIGLCCEFSEYEDLEEFHKDYDPEDYPDIEAIENVARVIPTRSGSFITSQF